MLRRRLNTELSTLFCCAKEIQKVSKFCFETMVIDNPSDEDDIPPMFKAHHDRIEQTFFPDDARGIGGLNQGDNGLHRVNEPAMNPPEPAMNPPEPAMNPPSLARDQLVEIIGSSSSGQQNNDFQAASTFHPHPVQNGGSSSGLHRVNEPAMNSPSLARGKSVEIIESSSSRQQNNDFQAAPTFRPHPVQQFHHNPHEGDNGCSSSGWHRFNEPAMNPPSLARDQSVEIIESSSSRQPNYDFQAASTFRPRPVPQFPHNPHEMAANFNLNNQERRDNRQFYPVNSNQHFGQNYYNWRNSYEHPGMMWQNSPYQTYPSHTFQGFQQIPLTTDRCVRRYTDAGESAEATSYDRRYTDAGESAEASSFHPRNGLHSPNPRGLVFPVRNQMSNSFRSHEQRPRRHRNKRVLSSDEIKQYDLDINRVRDGEDNRTTLMIKNIPNKYTSKMLLAEIDEHHKGNYDFLYLPIDFDNKCNVGYAFVNMTHPSLIIPFYEAFHGKKWKRFRRSFKVASIAYARIQGKEALISNFEHANLLREHPHYWPILISTEGPNAGQEIPFPMSANDKNTHEVNLQGDCNASSSRERRSP